METMTAKAIMVSLALCLLHLPGKMGIDNFLKRYYPLSAKLKTKNQLQTGSSTETHDLSIIRIG
jgi:hypothetical protein